MYLYPSIAGGSNARKKSISSVTPKVDVEFEVLHVPYSAKIANGTKQTIETMKTIINESSPARRDSATI